MRERAGEHREINASQIKLCRCMGGYVLFYFKVSKHLKQFQSGACINACLIRVIHCMRDFESLIVLLGASRKMCLLMKFY